MAKKKIILSVSILIVISALLWMFLMSSKDEPRDLPEIEKSGELVIVTDYNSVGYFVSGDTIAGFNHDLIQLLRLCTPLKIEIQLEANLDKSIEGLNKGKYDILIRNIPITSEMRGSLSFTEPIARNRQVLIQRKKDYNDNVEPVRSHLYLAGKTLHVPANSPAILRVRNLSHEIGDTIYIKEDELYGAEQLAMQVAAKEIDYAVCDEKIAIGVSKYLPEIDYSTFIGFTHIEAWAVSDKSPVLLDSLNIWIKKIKSMKQYDEIYQKYYE